MQNRIIYKVPEGYQPTDFQDLIDDILPLTKTKIEKSGIRLSYFNKSKQLDRFGKRFELSITSICGVSAISIKEIA